VPDEVIARFPRIAAGIRALRAAGFGILIKDASLGEQFPVMNVTLLHPEDKAASRVSVLIRASKLPSNGHSPKSCKAVRSTRWPVFRSQVSTSKKLPVRRTSKSTAKAFGLSRGFLGSTTGAQGCGHPNGLPSSPRALAALLPPIWRFPPLSFCSW